MFASRAWPAKWLRASWRETPEVMQTFLSAGPSDPKPAGMPVSPRSRTPLAWTREAYIKPLRPAVPELGDATRGVRNPIDRFVLARLESRASRLRRMRGAPAGCGGCRWISLVCRRRPTRWLRFSLTPVMPRTSGSWIACSLRRSMANVGRGHGSTSRGMPTRTGFNAMTSAISGRIAIG